MASRVSKHTVPCALQCIDSTCSELLFVICHNKPFSFAANYIKSKYVCLNVFLVVVVEAEGYVVSVSFHSTPMSLFDSHHVHSECT